MAGTPVVLIWDTDFDGQFHGGDKILYALKRAQKKNLIHLKTIEYWNEFYPFLSDELSNKIVNAEETTEIIFFLHTSEKKYCEKTDRTFERVLHELAEKKATGDWANFVEGKKPFVRILLYSGAGKPAGLEKEFNTGDWVVEIDLWHVDKTDDTLEEKVYSLFSEPVAKGDSRFAPLHELPEEPESMSKLVSLDILLRGYLAIWPPEERIRNEYEDLAKKKQHSKAKDMTTYKTLDDQRLFRPVVVDGHNVDREPASPSDLGWYWFDECLDVVRVTPFSHLKEKIPELGGCYNLEKIWNILRGESLGKPDGIHLKDDFVEYKAGDFRNLFCEAHMEFQDIVMAVPPKKKLEQARVHLNHNLVKNKFLMKIGELRKDLSCEERSQWIIVAWGYIRGTSDENEDIQSRIKTVKDALKNWPEVRDAIKDFLENEPERHGFKGTERLEEKKQHFFEDREALVSIIDRFVKDFDSIANEPEESRYIRLEEFWKAADEIHHTLSLMRYNIGNGNAQFEDFFQLLEKE